MVIENTLLLLLFVLALGLIIPELFKRFRIPLLTLIILAGAITGPHGLNYVKPDDTINFFGFLGMAFLMFMTGLETDITRLSKSKNKIVIMALLNALIPFCVGLIITKLFGYSWIVSILIGIVFISSSVAIIISSLKENKSISQDVAQLILSAVIVADIVSLIALGFIFQTTSKVTSLPLPVYFIILIASILALFRIVPIISKKIIQKKLSEDKGYERQLRFVIIILVGVIIYFSFLGAHPILASFLAGLSLSGAIFYNKSKILNSKLHTMGYGLFIPVFFFVIGMEMDISLLKEFDLRNIMMISLILGLIISKFVSGYLAGRIVKLSKKNSMLFGSISITQLTTTLAVTYAASSIGLLDSVLVTSIVLLSIITTLIGPILTSYISHLD
ncbi:MAG: cation:proton antiporter [Nanoarchaeota archaeon]|nr:cation:proton antiporter [Nanoarchaeota archaeon]MBU4456724.1 cation:proton antiporter [Nanoarchaeota archaeon]MCG2720062.1 cation:proton antiporter [Nanoarchaeota archaeon]